MVEWRPICRGGHRGPVRSATADVRFEIAFVVDKARKEATFSADGAFVEEE